MPQAVAIHESLARATLNAPKRRQSLGAPLSESLVAIHLSTASENVLRALLLGPASTSQLAKRTRQSDATCLRSARMLLAAGLIDREGNNKETIYSITDDGRNHPVIHPVTPSRNDGVTGSGLQIDPVICPSDPVICPSSTPSLGGVGVAANSKSPSEEAVPQPLPHPGVTSSALDADVAELKRVNSLLVADVSNLRVELARLQQAVQALATFSRTAIQAGASMVEGAQLKADLDAATAERVRQARESGEIHGDMERWASGVRKNLRASAFAGDRSELDGILRSIQERQERAERAKKASEAFRREAEHRRAKADSELAAMKAAGQLPARRRA